MGSFLADVMSEIIGERTGGRVVTSSCDIRSRLHQGHAGANDAMSEKEKFRKNCAQIRTSPETRGGSPARKRQFLPQRSTGSNGGLEGGSKPSTHMFTCRNYPPCFLRSQA